MKKTLALIISFVLVAGMISGCSKEEDDNEGISVNVIRKADDDKKDEGAVKPDSVEGQGDDRQAEGENSVEGQEDRQQSETGLAGADGAKWSGYDKSSFEEFLKSGAEALIVAEGGTADGENLTVSYTWGWTDADKLETVKIDDSGLKDGEKKVTYTLEVKQGDTTGKTVFYAVLNEAENSLEMKGAYSCRTGEEKKNEADAKKAEQLLEELRAYCDKKENN